MDHDHAFQFHPPPSPDLGPLQPQRNVPPGPRAAAGTMKRFMHATGGAREQALRPPASVGVGAPVVLQRCDPPDGKGGKALREGVA